MRVSRAVRRSPIAHVIFPRPSLLRPVPEFAWDAARILAGTRGLDVEIILPVPHPAAAKLQGLSRTVRGARAWPEGLEEVLRALDPKPTLVHYLPLPLRSIQGATAAVAATLLSRRRAARPALIEGSFLDEGGYAAAVAAKAIGARSIAVAHGSDVRSARDPGADGARARRVKDTLRHASAVAAVSHALVADLALLGCKAELLRFTVEASRYQATPVPSGSPLLLFVGRLSRAKGVDTLLAALAGLDRKDTRLRLVGAPTDDLDVPAEARKLGIEERVELLGEVSQADLQAHYQQACCLILPSRAEGLGNVMIEALLSGRPVIGAETGGIPEVVNARNGRLFPPGDAVALTDAIDQVIGERDRGRWRAEALRASALPFTWEEMGPRLAELTFRLIEAS